MSWSITFVGTPEELVTKLQQQAESYKGWATIEAEYNGALPHMIGIVQQNFGDPNRKLRIDAYGHGGEMHQAEGPSQPYRQCTVIIKEWDSRI